MLKSTSINESPTSLFFSYGSNILTLRIRLENIRSEFLSIARLDNHRVDFIRYSKFWGGPQATIVPTANCHVWGVIWRVNNDDLSILDNQEGVETKRYYIKHIEVDTPHMGKFVCRAYIQKVNPLPRGDNDDIPPERWPSYAYKKVMIVGAIEHHLPEYYIENLKKLKDNGELGCFRMANFLKIFVTKDPCQCKLPPKPGYKVLNLRKMRLKKLKEQNK
ncbi:gamma-glutamylcyclotransferase-like [Battus philenor]|uniref:gamma-glutamylcyclotransferase-like n=1 Tax=Battus philenor TaxID=42288 RepID=UPI0035CF37DB